MRLVFVVLVLGWAGFVYANPETLSERSQASAREVLDRAVNALGGAASLGAIERIRFRIDGQAWERLQMQTPYPPFEASTLQETILVDLANDRVRIDEQGVAPGTEYSNSVIVQGASATTYNHRLKLVVPSSAASVRSQFASRFRWPPQLLLRQALDNVSTLRHLGRDEWEGKPHDVITFVTPRAEQVSVFVDAATHLVAKCELVYLDSLTGDEAAEFAFGEYSRVNNQLVPQVWTLHEAGTVVGKFRVQTELNPVAAESAFEVPHEGYVSVEASPPLKPHVEQLAEGVFVMRNIAGPNQHSLVVAFKDHLLVVEAPGSSEGADRLIARIKETVPGKPIRYVAMTHHHGDHVGGLRSFIAEGATVLTTPGNQEYVEALARAPHFDRLREQPRKVDVQTLSKGKRVLGDRNGRVVELIDIGPNPHAREMVVAYLPRERILFAADVFTMPYTARPPGLPQPQTSSFAKRIQALGLKVDRLVGAHGRTATASEFSEWSKLPL